VKKSQINRLILNYPTVSERSPAEELLTGERTRPTRPGKSKFKKAI